MGTRRKKKHYTLTPLGYITLFALIAIVIAIVVLCSGKDKTSSPSESFSPSSKSSSVAEVKDTTPPVIEGAKDIAVYVGDTVSYRKGVTATDETDGDLPLTIDSSAVDLSAAGTYQVFYSATDTSGNEARVSISVTVGKKPVVSSEAASLESFSKEDVYELADKKLESLIKDGMTVKEQAKAIYKWANGSIWYSGSSDKTDYLKEAKKVLNGGGTDCFGYFAVCKLMFERLGIPNIDVVKVKNYDKDSSHFWSLVSIDGGQTYYHFDATPRKGDGDYFFLVTDKALDEYSNSHSKSHNRDKSLYPATPEE